ncbi:MAG TPA: Ig-like domain-containing protein, partial [Chloroflexota bacterium]|nr:Ig-like domain-containing protein [Chloroflexota bacterium]
IVVTIDKPSDRKTFPANAFVPISVKVASTGSITTVELWVDGILVDQKKPTGFQKRYSAHFSWQPGGKGEHSIVGRAVDEGGAFADSKSVRITATGSVEPLALIDVRQGETLRTLADRLNAPVEQITALNPGISLNQSLQPGATLFAPLSSGNTASGGGRQTRIGKRRDGRECAGPRTLPSLAGHVERDLQ